MYTPLRKTFDNPEYLTKSRKYDHKCVCDICNCGKHRCPQKNMKFQAQTTNHHDYKPYVLSPQKQRSQRQQPRKTHYDPDLLKTSYNTQYTPHRISANSPSPKKSDFVPSKFKLDDQTEYRKNYKPNEVKEERPKLSPSKYVPNSSKFDGTTTYSRQFSPKKGVNSISPSKKANTYEPNPYPFEGKTTYQNQFTPYKIDSSQYKRPNTQGQNSQNAKPTKFEGQSRYREFYTPHEIQPKERCPTEYLPARPIKCSPGKDHLHYSAEKDYWE